LNLRFGAMTLSDNETHVLRYEQIERFLI
jgi:hypothetical protein